MSDGPCGDCNWQPSTAQFSKLEYIGIDLVPQLILGNARKYRHARNMRFVNLDLVLDDLPKSDIFMVCFLIFISHEFGLRNRLDSAATLFSI